VRSAIEAPRSSNRRPEWNVPSKHALQFFWILLSKIHPEMAFGTRKNNLERIATVLANEILLGFCDDPTNNAFSKSSLAFHFSPSSFFVNL